MKIITVEHNQVTVTDRGNTHVDNCCHIFTRNEFETIISENLNGYESIAFEPSRGVYIVVDDDHSVTAYDDPSEEPMLQLIREKLDTIIFATETALQPSKEFVNGVWVDKPKTHDEILKEVTQAIQEMLDSKAQELRYDNIMSARSYAGYENQFQTEAQSLAIWCASCWKKAGEIEALGKTVSIEEVLAQMPAYSV